METTTTTSLAPGERCFFCLREGKCSEDFSLRSLFHYLGLDEGKRKKPKNEQCQHPKESMVQLCKRCSGLLAKFQNLFQLWQEVEIKLSACLGEIGSQLGNETEISENRKDQTIRKRIKEKCLSKALAFQPEVVLQAGKSETKQKQTEIKTESLDSSLSNDLHDDDDLLTLFQNDGSEPEPEVEDEPDIKYEVPSSLSGQIPGHDPEGEPKLKIKEPRRRRCKVQYKIRPDPSTPGHHLCELCNRSYNRLKTCREHYKRRHLGRRPLKKSYECSICNKVFLSRAGFIDHENGEHKGVRFHCPYCSKPFKYNQNKVRHEVLCSLNPASKQRRSKCRICREEFLGKESLKDHIEKAHGDVLRFMCPACGSRFSHEWKMELHVRRVHDQKGPYVCETCGVELGSERTLKQHLNLVHLKERKYACDKCEKTFAYGYRLKMHRSVEHMGRRFGCPEPGCGKLYNSKQSLSFHRHREHPPQTLK